MSRQHGRCYCIFILAVGIIVAAAPGMAAEWQTSLSAPVIENVDGGRNHGLRLKQPGAAVVQPPQINGGSPEPETDLMLVTRQSCSGFLRNAPLSAIPMFGGDDRHGEWVLLAGVGWNKDSGFGATGPVLIETGQGLEAANLYFTVEMLFIPADRWNIRANLAIDGEDLHGAIADTDPQLNPLHIGIAIAFDYGDKSPLVLNLGYDRLPPKGRVLSVGPDDSRPDHVLAETRVFSACLNIQF